MSKCVEQRFDVGISHHPKALEMISFQFKRNTARAGVGSVVAGKAAVGSGFMDSTPSLSHPESGGWFDSSADLKGGLQVREDDLDTLPAEYRDVFPSR